MMNTSIKNYPKPGAVVAEVLVLLLLFVDNSGTVDGSPSGCKCSTAEWTCSAAMLK